MYMSMYIHIESYRYNYICIFMYIYICICICTYVYIYIYTFNIFFARLHGDAVSAAAARSVNSVLAGLLSSLCHAVSSDGCAHLCTMKPLTCCHEICWQGFEVLRQWREGCQKALCHGFAKCWRVLFQLCCAEPPFLVYTYGARMWKFPTKKIAMDVAW